MDQNLLLMVLHLANADPAYDFVPGDECRNAQIALEAGRKLSVTVQLKQPDGTVRPVTYDIMDVECLRPELEKGRGKNDARGNQHSEPGR
jgi:hypothetical protein